MSEDRFLINVWPIINTSSGSCAVTVATISSDKRDVSALQSPHHNAHLPSFTIEGSLRFFRHSLHLIESMGRPLSWHKRVFNSYGRSCFWSDTDPRPGPSMSQNRNEFRQLLFLRLLGYLMTQSVQRFYRRMRGWLNDGLSGKDLERSVLDLIWGNILESAWWVWGKPRKTPLRTGGVLTYIRSGHLQRTSLELCWCCCCYNYYYCVLFLLLLGALQLLLLFSRVVDIFGAKSVSLNYIL
jgi:hypothetical protein